MKRGKRTRRVRDVRARLHAEATRLAEETFHLAYAAVRFQRDHLDRFERGEIEEAHGLLNKAGRALEALARRLSGPARRRR
ncbi:hypothetical protein [Sorangium sp. So ce1151]|uniref:hypothetical protein n=1 Tax=Sorangium sp. So ce1151 TaxID=3133332 RepID=UPI003F602D7C